MEEIIEKLVSKHTLILGKCKTLEDYAKAENNFTNDLLKAINYSQCCKSDSELLPKRLSNRRELLRDYEKFTDPDQNMKDAEQNIAWFLGE